MTTTDTRGLCPPSPDDRTAETMRARLLADERAARERLTRERDEARRTLDETIVADAEDRACRQHALDVRTRERDEARAEVERLRVQLAGCGVAAHGGTSPEVVAERGAYGWSPAYEDTLTLRRQYDALREQVETLGERVSEAFDDIETALADACHAGGLSTPRYRNTSRMLAALCAERERFARVVEAARVIRADDSYGARRALDDALDALDGGDQ